MLIQGCHSLNNYIQHMLSVYILQLLSIQLRCRLPGSNAAQRRTRFIRTRVHGPEKACTCRGQVYICKKPTQLRQARRRLWHTTWSSCSASTSLTVQKMHAAQVSCVQSNGCAQGKCTKKAENCCAQVCTSVTACTLQLLLALRACDKNSVWAF